MLPPGPRWILPAEAMVAGAALRAASTTGRGRLTLTRDCRWGSSTLTCSQGVGDWASPRVPASTSAATAKMLLFIGLPP